MPHRLNDETNYYVNNNRQDDKAVTWRLIIATSDNKLIVHQLKDRDSG